MSADHTTSIEYVGQDLELDGYEANRYEVTCSCGWITSDLCGGDAYRAATTHKLVAPVQAGLLPVGTVIELDGEQWTIVDTSATAYRVETDRIVFVDEFETVSNWVSFDRVHGKPSPMLPLVVLS